MSSVIALVRFALPELNKNLVVSGSTGVLGSSLCLEGCKRFYDVYAGYRCIDKLSVLMERGKVLEREIKPFHDDLEKNPNNLPVLLNPNGKSSVFVNNAAVCLKGSSRETLQKSIKINTISPLSRTMNLVHLTNTGNITIINVSSGDGDMVFLNTYLQRRFEGISNLPVRTFDSTLLANESEKLQAQH